ncbi:hypothetical protein MTO96_032430 [Rhipicephalus appendiculatus]
MFQVVESAKCELYHLRSEEMFDNCLNMLPKPRRRARYILWNHRAIQTACRQRSAVIAGEPEPVGVAEFPRGVSASLAKVVGAVPVDACSRGPPDVSSSRPRLLEVAVPSASSSSVVAGTGTQEASLVPAGDDTAGAVESEAVGDASMALCFSQLPIAWTAWFSIWCCCVPLAYDVGRALVCSEA